MAIFNSYVKLPEGNSGEQKSLVWQSQTAKIIWDQPSFLQFLELLCCRPVVILHLQHTCCAGRRQVIHGQPSAQRTRGTRGTWRLACSSASSAFCLVSQAQNIGEKMGKIAKNMGNWAAMAI